MPPSRASQIQEDDLEEGQDRMSGIEQRIRNARRTGQARRVVVIDDDEEHVARRQQRELSVEREAAIVLGLDDDEIPAAIVLDLDDDGLPPDLRHRRNLRNRPIEPYLRLSEFQHGNYTIKAGTVVEVPTRPPEERSWQFLEVRYIRTEGGEVWLRGIPLTRLRHLRGMFLKQRNEVCAVLEVDQNDPRKPLIQAAKEVNVDEVIRRRTVNRTNAMFPENRFDRKLYKTNEAIENRAPLTQRWIITFHYKSAAYREKKALSPTGEVYRLMEKDIKDPAFRVSDRTLLNRFRGGKVRGGSWVCGKETVPLEELIEDDMDAAPTTRLMGQKYTMADICCGAGGASEGARQAGFRMTFACDFDAAACRSYHVNHSDTDLEESDIFVSMRGRKDARSKHHVDVAHTSPPCQVFSPAHTVPGKNDDANAAALMCVQEVLEQLRPRFGTGEQTFGLLFDLNEDYFNSLVCQYTSHGFSFRWDTLPFQEFGGTCQTRRRLLWIGSCPSERMAPFPARTHNVTGLNGLPKPSTLGGILRNVPSFASLHDDLEMAVRAARPNSRFPRSPYDAEKKIGTITTSGSTSYHPDGLRNFTLRELASIQTFPPTYDFLGNVGQIKRQIGNAFPPGPARVLFAGVHKWLMELDNVVDEVIDLSSDDDDNVIILDDNNGEAIIIDDDSDEKTRRNRRLEIRQNARANRRSNTQPNVRPNVLPNLRPNMLPALRPSRNVDAIMIDDDEDHQMADRSIPVHREYVVISDEDENDNAAMMDYSRESSRTLSAGSQDGMEID
ncbi:Uu.00g114910.m01.CDS01 [Anthostomella pinea]|uniref:DNA (cytosine-5-)-methyltransferase n=1 Tax=Anthostomella pinea TaxID=933095 RepID=A0AAI8YGU3_9PEZI|nr:Uu.00g114910.m01.CDS01 [Anthostomella pinea]